jgi:hypothetical protein
MMSTRLLVYKSAMRKVFEWDTRPGNLAIYSSRPSTCGTFRALQLAFTYEMNKYGSKLAKGTE